MRQACKVFKVCKCLRVPTSSVYFTAMLRLQLIGRLGADAEVRDAAGKKVISFNVAHSEQYTDRQGVRQERTTWVRCSLWRQEGRTGVAQYLTKGTQVYLEGSPSVRTYENKEGLTVASFELTVLGLELLGGRNDNPSGGGGPQNAYGAYDSPKGPPTNPQVSEPKTSTPYEDPNEGYEDDLPF